MLKTLIKTYHKVNNVSRLKVIEKIMGDENFFREEINCFDDGRIESSVKQMQASYDAICTEIKFLKESAAEAVDTKDKLQYLYKKQYEILKSFAFEASQNMKNIDSCLEIMKDLKDDFYICLQGMEAYAEGDKVTAFEKLKEYLQLQKTFGNHYLLNKFYGLLLFEHGRHNESKIFLQRVTQICPEDVEVHEKMQALYHIQGNCKGEETEKKILLVLGAA